MKKQWDYLSVSKKEVLRMVMVCIFAVGAPILAVVAINRQEIIHAPAEAPAVTSAETNQPDQAIDEAITKAGKDLINIRFTDESLDNVVNIFTKMLGINIIASPADLQGKNVTVNLVEVEWKPTLCAILDMHNLALIEKTPGSGVYSIIPRVPDAAEPMVAETLYLSHKTVSEVKPLIESLLTPNAKVLGFASGNAIVVKTTEANLGEIKQVIQKIDIPGKQVCVETKFMELNDEASKQLGIDWQMLQGATLNASGMSIDYSETRRKMTMDEGGTVRTTRDVTTTTDGTSTREKTDSTTGFQVTGDNVSQVDVGSDGTITRTSVSPVDRREIRAAVLGVDDFEIVLSALNEMDGASVISSPKMIVASGTTNAHFNVGKRWPVRKFTQTYRGQEEGIRDVIEELDTSIKTDYIDGGYLRTGIDLRVIPTVKTEDLIEAIIEPKLIERIKNTYEDVSWPTLSVKEITTMFTLRSGQTVAIGGLTSTTDTKEVSKVPLLGSIPLIGRLFSHTYEAQKQIETIIFVTLSLAEPNSLRKEEGIPEEAELVHKKLLQSKTRKQKFQADLDKMRKATEAKPKDVKE